MSRSLQGAKKMSVARVERLHAASPQTPVHGGSPARADAPHMITARVVSLDGARARLETSRGTVEADIDPSVHLAVMTTAQERGERVLVEVDGDRRVVVGALRTQPTPGIDRADAYAIEAKTVSIDAEKISLEGDEVKLSSKTARIVLRAASEIESFADRIVSRAEGVHKIVGRMLRLN